MSLKKPPEQPVKNNNEITTTLLTEKLENVVAGSVRTRSNEKAVKYCGHGQLFRVLYVLGLMTIK